MVECVKCKNTFEGNFCPNCGWKVLKGRYDLKTIASDTVESLDIHNGFFQTMKIIMIRPGPSIRMYLEGKIALYNPFKLLVLMGAFATILTFRFDLFEGAAELLARLNLESQESFNAYSGKYFSLTNLLGLPAFTLFTWLIYRNEKINISESLVINTYIIVAQYIIIVLYLPVVLLSPDPTPIFIVYIYAVVNSGYNIWVLIGYSKINSKMVRILKAILTVGISAAVALFFNYFIFKITPQSVLDFLEIL